jgi:hypothetical protein
MTYKGSVTIDDMPIPLDWRHQIHDFLNVRLPPEEMLFARHYFGATVNPLVCENVTDYLKPPYPPLPPIQINEYQCPTGASRYGRALLIVDWPVLRHIAVKCWGWSPTTINDSPQNWKTVTGNRARAYVDVKFHDGTNEFLVKNMTPLPPHRIPGSRVDLWLLPLVDERFYLLHEMETSINATPVEADPEADPPVEARNAWNVFFDNFTLTGQASVHDDYQKPDERLTDLDAPQPSPILLDIAALSVGLRVVFDPTNKLMHLMNAEDSKKLRSYRIASPGITSPNLESATSALMISGGLTGAAAYPDRVNVYYQIGDEKPTSSRSVTFPTGGLTSLLSDFSIFTSWIEDGEEITEEDTTAFANRVVTDVWSWYNSGGQYCFAGIVNPKRTVAEDPEEPETTVEERIAVNGFDDYFSIQIQENPKSDDGTEYFLTHRFYELPPMFLPSVLLVAGKKKDCGSGVSSSSGCARFFWVNEDVSDQVEVEAVPGSYLSPSNGGNPETIINWGAESVDSPGGIIDGAKQGYLTLCVPVDDVKPNPDYQPDENEPDFDDRETIPVVLWVVTQGHCIFQEPEEE